MKADFSKIIRDSVQITKSNKKLWVLGLVVASLSGGMNFGASRNFSSSNSFKEEKKENVELNSLYKYNNAKPNLLNSNLLSTQLPQVLGATTNSFTDMFKSIPVSFYFALGFAILLSISIGVGIAIYAGAWSQSSLIHGVEGQSIGESLSLYQMSDKGKLNAIEVIKIRIIPMLLFNLLIILSGVVLIAPVLLLKDGGRVISIALGIPWVFALIIAGIIISVSSNLGVLAINLDSLRWKEAFKRGWHVFKKHFLDVFVMSIINCFAGCLAGGVSLIALGVFAGIGVAGIVGAVAVPPLLVVAGPIVALLVLALIFLMGLVGAIMAVFKQSTWVLLYKQLREETNGQ